MFEQLRGILARAQTCAKGHDVDGVQSALVEAELELTAVEAAVAQADAENAEPAISPAQEAGELETGDEPPAEPEPGSEPEPQADGGEKEPEPPQVFQ